MLLGLCLVLFSGLSKALFTDVSAREIRPFVKIFGGDYAEEGEYPFMLSMEQSGSHFCGASAISDYWAITAAHCLVGTDPEELSLRAGSLTQAKGGTLHQAVEIFIYPKYYTTQFDEDIALVKVKNPFSENDYVEYVKLPDQWEPLEVGSEAMVAGWGLTSMNWDAELSEKLKDVKIIVMNPEKCAENPQNRGSFLITDNMICAAAEGEDTCPGDSGGPVVVKEGDHQKLVGLVSWGDGKGDLNNPGIYTRVSQYRLWIFMKTSV
uniref:Peptidase S1 domain-containing protein n=1 Tax=Timema genevievae TaxID=629358 RepID=A0A7R9JWP2_TIMGE|nr:unnamed protein product [Timema genevievae]